MKKSAAALAFTSLTLASATAFACPTATGPFESALFIGLFTSVFWVPLSVLTCLVLFFLRERFESRRGLVVSMLGSIPFSMASVIGMIFVASELLRPALQGETLVFAAMAGCVTALNAGYVALCHHFGKKRA